METQKLVSLQKPKKMEKTEKDPVFYKDIRFWLALIISLLLLYMTATSYPAVW